MKITSVRVKNFRLLKAFEIFLEDDLSLVIGKNNTGKTSLLLALGKFLAGAFPVFYGLRVEEVGAAFLMIDEQRLPTVK